jgi:hypothetical protein
MSSGFSFSVLPDNANRRWQNDQNKNEIFASDDLELP